MAPCHRQDFVVDAQLPALLARFLAAAGHDSVHTCELPDGSRTTKRVADLVSLVSGAPRQMS